MFDEPGALALTLALAAFLVSLLALWRTRPRRRGGIDDLPADVQGLRQEVAALRAEARDSLRHVAVVRYDAFGDVGGQLSWSLALLDDGGDGMVVTAIHGRSEARTYAKSISGWRCAQQLSPEEEEAIGHARARPE